MLRTNSEERYSSTIWQVTVTFMAVTILMSVFSAVAAACCVGQARIYAGRNWTEACDQDYDGKTMYICVGDRAYFCAKCSSVINPGNKDLIYYYDFGDGDSNTIPEAFSNDHVHNQYHTYNTAGDRKVMLKVWVDGVPDRFYE